MNYAITGSPAPEVAAAIVACIEQLRGPSATPSVPLLSAWRRAGIGDSVRVVVTGQPSVTWRMGVELQ